MHSLTYRLDTSLLCEFFSQEMKCLLTDERDFSLLFATWPCTRTEAFEDTEQFTLKDKSVKQNDEHIPEL